MHRLRGEGRQAFNSLGFSLLYRVTTVDHFLNLVIFDERISDVPNNFCGFAAFADTGTSATASNRIPAARDAV
tara:strand:- start:2018 stop:2236 length:219 start_codon:yes stop_codon:yes gene_type:complete